MLLLCVGLLVALAVGVGLGWVLATTMDDDTSHNNSNNTTSRPDTPPPHYRHAPEECAVTLEYDPVCAFGKTYGGADDAMCEGAYEYTPGECTPEQRCFCPADPIKDSRPVCAHGRSYINECLARCAGNTRWTEGECYREPKFGPTVPPHLRAGL